MFARLFRSNPAKAAGRKLYQAVTLQARQPTFYADLGAPDTVEGRFELYNLHVVVLLHRLKGLGGMAGETAQALFDSYVSSLDDALREMGVGDISVGKKMRKLGEAIYGRVRNFDQIFGQPKDGELEAFIARTVYAGQTTSHVGVLASYVRRAVESLADQPLEALLEGRPGVAADRTLSAPDSPWPVIVRLSDIARFTADAPASRRLIASVRDRAAIAKILDLVSLDRLEADVDLSGWFDGVRIDARWRADIVQTCGVSLDDFATALSGEFTLRAVPQTSRHAAPPAAEVEIDIDAEDPPDVLESDEIDLGGYVVEHLALDIDPFPRKPGAVFEAPQAQAETSPFAALLKFKKPDSQA